MQRSCYENSVVGGQLSISEQNLTVLLVEDQDHMLRYSQKLLKKLNVQVICAQNGVEGLQALSQHKVDLILTDIMMPEMDGFEFCEEVRMQSDTHDIPIIVHSSNHDSHHVIKALRLGADDFVAKTCNIALLEAVMERALSRV